MPSLKQILIGVAVIVFLSTYKIIWYYIKRLLFKPDVQKLMDARDIPGLLRALSYKKDKYEFAYIRSNAAIALGNVGYTNQLDALVERLHDDDQTMVKAAIQSIGQITLRCVRQPMFEAFQEEDHLRIQSLISTLQSIQAKVTSTLIGLRGDSTETQLVAQTLGIVGGSEAFAFLRKLLKKTNDDQTRKVVLQAILSTGDPNITEAFLSLLKTKKPALHIMAADVLGNFKEPRAAAPLGKLLTSPNRDVRKSAAEALGKIGDPKVAADILTLLSDPDPACRKTAADTLALLGDGKWTQWINGDKDDFNRLAGSGEPMAFDIISKAPDNLAVPALGDLGDKRALEPLVTKLKDNDEDIRINAITALGKLGDADAADALKTVIADGSAQVRKEAAAALDKLGQSQWTQWVKGNENDFHRLARSKDPLVFDLLLKLDQNPKAISALGTMGDKRAVEPLIKTLAYDNPDIKAAAIDALGNFRDTRAVQPLIKEMENDNGEIMMSALKLLGSLGDKRAARPIRKLLASWNVDLRLEAAAALAKMGEPKWQEMGIGSDDDFNKLLYCDDSYLVSEAIDYIKSGLNYGSLQDRKETARVLIKLAKNPPEVLKNFWKEIRTTITTRHEDSHHDIDSNRSSDCTHTDYHTDTGIGLSAPELPAQS